MESALIILSLILSHFAVNNYFLIKAYDIIKDYELENNNEILEVIGIVGSENIVNDIESKKEDRKFMFILQTTASIIVIILLLFYAFLFDSFDIIQILSIAAFTIVLLLLIILDKYLMLKELVNFKDPEYQIAYAEENKRLQPIRIFFFISSIIVIILVLVIQSIYDLEKSNVDYYNLSLSIIFLYLGGMGLIAKLMFLKVPFRLDGKLQPYINTAVLLGGLYLFFSSLYKILFN